MEGQKDEDKTLPNSLAHTSFGVIQDAKNKTSPTIKLNKKMKTYYTEYKVHYLPPTPPGDAHQLGRILEH